jgi:gluconate 5-dehydrogenase
MRVVQTGIKEHGKIDVLINNAGVSDLRGLAAEVYDTATWNWILSIDLTGAFMFLREVGHHMLQRQSGSIVNICSIMGSGANESNIIAYAAAKGGLRNVTAQVGCEWADRGVRVNSVSPGFIMTEMVRPALETLGMDKWIASRTPMRRIGDLHEIVGPVMFLASDAASYITGHDLLVDGGTNAANGYYQVPPIHHEWNKGDLEKVGKGYPGVQPRPDWYEALAPGIPGLHYPLPEA